MATSQHSLRKAIGALKDSTKVGLAKVNGDYKGLDVAVVKATKHKEKLPKEKHVRTILIALSFSSPRPDVAFCIHALFKRLAKTHTWTVALKTLIVIHRAMRDVDYSFHNELIALGRGRGYVLNLAHFRDESSSQAWDYSTWIRTYALYLEERLECFYVLQYDVDRDQSRNRRLDTTRLLEHLPVLQELLSRLLACKPEGAALHNRLINYVLSIIAGESVKLYIAITDGILNLVDKYFEMQHQDAVKALEIYRRAGSQASQLSEFFELCRGLPYGHAQKYLKIKPLPESFLTAMEDYVKEAPELLALPSTQIKDDEGGADSLQINTSKSESLIDHDQDTDVQEKSSPSAASSEQPQSDPKQDVAKLEIGDLLSFDDPPEEGHELNENNPLALALVESENPSNAGNGVSSASATTGWELELFSAPISNEAAVAENKLTGALDRLTLDSLYNQAMARTTNPDTAYKFGQLSRNPFEVDYNQDPFCGSSTVTPPTDLQMVAKVPQQTYIMQEQQLQQQQELQLPMIGYVSPIPSGNPFADQTDPLPSQPPENSNSGLI